MNQKYFIAILIISFIQITFIKVTFSNLNNINDENLINDFKILKKLSRKKKFNLTAFIEKIFELNEKDPYKNIQANLRNSNALCNEELEYLNFKTNHTKTSLENFLKIKIKNKIPRIALCFTGGGYRALIESLGFLIGAKNIGLLDCVSYIASLSGSSWLISSWIAHTPSLNLLQHIIANQVTKHIIKGLDCNNLIQNCISNIIYGQNTTLVNIWGSLLGNLFFNDLGKQILFTNQITRIPKTQMPKLSQLKEKIQKNLLPIPIFTAVKVGSEYEWFEFTPYEIGNIKSQLFIPSWSFGRKFENGLSINHFPEFGLDYYLGIWGSVFTANIKDILNMYNDSLSPILLKFLDKIAEKPDSLLANLRISPAIINNFAYKFQNSKESNESLNETLITLVDAGLDCTIPIAPILRPERKIDIIIICDSSAEIKTASALSRAEEYAIKNNLKFPKINYDNLDINTISIFKDDNNKDIPVIIYIPCIKNNNYSQTIDPIQSIQKSGYCSTFNLKYTCEQFYGLCGLAEFNISSNSDLIIKTIKERIN